MPHAECMWQGPPRQGPAEPCWEVSRAVGASFSAPPVGTLQRWAALKAVWDWLSQVLRSMQSPVQTGVCYGRKGGLVGISVTCLVEPRLLGGILCVWHHEDTGPHRLQGSATCCPFLPGPGGGRCSLAGGWVPPECLREKEKEGRVFFMSASPAEEAGSPQDPSSLPWRNGGGGV